MKQCKYWLCVALACLLFLTTGKMSWGQELPIVNDGTSKSAVPDARVPRFDVVSVKENKGDGHMVRMAMAPDGFSATNLKLRDLICMAYGVRPDQIVGAPEWVGSTGFDIDAKVDGSDVAVMKELTISQRRAMLVPLLSDRFGLQLHKEQKTMAVYDLVVRQGGVKLKPAAASPTPDDAHSPDAGPQVMMGAGQMSGSNLSTAILADQLATVLKRTVIDQTNLAGKYDVHLQWSPDEESKMGDSDAASTRGPSIFTAVQEQLGLQLVPGRGPVEILAVDQVTKPSPN
jgi:uncharacterized protein (TIGR03435 family)